MHIKLSEIAKFEHFNTDFLPLQKENITTKVEFVFKNWKRQIYENSKAEISINFQHDQLVCIRSV